MFHRLLTTVFGIVMLAIPALAADYEASEDDQQITISTPELEAVVRKI